jgi:hypothetical protein
MSEAQPGTIAEFVAKHGIALEYKSTFRNPCMDDAPMNHYSVRLKKLNNSDKREMIVTYSKGLGLVVKARRSWENDKPIPPQVTEVLDNLASDAQGVEDVRSFEEWADNYGYDTDSRKAEEVYKVCLRQAKELQDFLGREAYNELLYHTERE